MIEVAISSLLMLLVVGALITVCARALTPKRMRRRHLRPGITSRGAMMLFSIDH